MEIILYFLFCLLIGYGGRSKKYGFWFYTFISIILTPVTGAILLIVMPYKRFPVMTIQAKTTAHLFGSSVTEYGEKHIIYSDQINNKRSYKPKRLDENGFPINYTQFHLTHDRLDLYDNAINQTRLHKQKDIDTCTAIAFDDDWAKSLNDEKLNVIKNFDSNAELIIDKCDGKNTDELLGELLELWKYQKLHDKYEINPYYFIKTCDLITLTNDRIKKFAELNGNTL